MTFFYRFRSIDAVLGERQELEKQEIYFCPPEALNDPIEGFKDLYWQGDAIVWRNLFKHYLLCLLHAVNVTLLSGKDHVAAGHDKFIFSTQRDLPTPELRSLYREICEGFFGTARIAELPDLLAARPYKMRREELHFYLRAVHGIAFVTIVDTLRKHRILPPLATTEPRPFAPGQHIDTLIRAMGASGFSDPTKEEEAFRLLYESMAHVNDQLDFISYTHIPDDLSRAWHGISGNFPERYSRALQQLIYQDWYAACFVASPNQAAMWGVYGDGHKGVCLKFKAKENKGGLPTLKFRGVVGWSGGRGDSHPVIGDMTLGLRKATYTNKFLEVDFFRSLGRLPVPILRNEWYTSEDGTQSPCASEILAEKDEWRQNYWKAFYEVATSKLRDWEHESEYRLILSSAISSFEKPEHRKLVYDFADLAGITFGINTPIETKDAIAKIIEKKCKESQRQSFEFSQAVYSSTSGKIEIRNSDLLRFS